MRTREVIVAAAAALSLYVPCSAQEAPSMAQLQAVTVNASVDRVTASASVDREPLEKAVSSKDKATIEMIGTVYSVSLVDSGCVGALGSPVAFVTLYSKAAPLGWVGVGCAGGTLGPCLGLTPGKRVRIQGSAALMPDVNAPGFDPCNVDTWQLPEVGSLNVLIATKITK
jgi:hypothetical protein